jgi:hypothetical protein
MSATQTGAGIFDYHALLALRQGWRIYATNQSQFNKLFPGVNQTTIDTWFQALTARELVFEEASRRGPPRIPGVVVWLESENQEQEPLGQDTWLRTADNTWIQQILVRQTIAIELRAQSPEVVRALSVVIRAVMNLATNSFNKIGYPLVDYIGHTTMTFEEQMIAEQAGLAGISMRTLRYRSMAMIDIPEVTEAPEGIDWFVLADDMQLAGIPGGVVPLPE